MNRAKFSVSFVLKMKAVSKIRTPELSLIKQVRSLNVIQSGSELVILDSFIESTMFCDGNFTASLKLENFNLDRVQFDTYSYK